MSISELTHADIDRAELSEAFNKVVWNAWHEAREKFLDRTKISDVLHALHPRFEDVLFMRFCVAAWEYRADAERVQQETERYNDAVKFYKQSQAWARQHQHDIPFGSGRETVEGLARVTDGPEGPKVTFFPGPWWQNDKEA